MQNQNEQIFRCRPYFEPISANDFRWNVVHVRHELMTVQHQPDLCSLFSSSLNRLNGFGSQRRIWRISTPLSLLSLRSRGCGVAPGTPLSPDTANGCKCLAKQSNKFCQKPVWQPINTRGSARGESSLTNCKHRNTRCVARRRKLQLQISTISLTFGTAYW